MYKTYLICKKPYMLNVGFVGGQGGGGFKGTLQTGQIFAILYSFGQKNYEKQPLQIMF